MTTKHPSLDELRAATVDILTDSLGLPNGDMGTTLADLDLDSLSMAELLVKLEARLGLPEIALTSRDPGLTLGELTELIHSGISREKDSAAR